MTVEKSRFKSLLIGYSKPRRDRSEEVVGYRKALDLIHIKHKSLHSIKDALDKPL